MLPDSLERQAQVGLDSNERRLGHRRIRSFCGVFDNGQAAALFDGSQSGSTIGTHTGENDPNRRAFVGHRNRATKRIGSRAGIVDTRTLIEPNQSRAYQHVMVRGCDIDVAGLDESTMSTMRGRKLADYV